MPAQDRTVQATEVSPYLRASLTTALITKLQSQAWKLRHRAWLTAREHPAAFFRIAPHRGLPADQLVDPCTELVIEGYPRSANSFAVVAFQLAQSKPRRLAHHTHAPAQVIRAAQLGIPALVLIRHPRDAVTSLLIHDQRYSVGLALHAYERFYRAILPYRDRLLMAEFEDVTQDLAGVIDRLNSTFGTDFDIPNMNPEMVETCFRRLEKMNEALGGSERTVPRPSAWRQKQSCELSAGVQASGRYGHVPRLYEQMTRPWEPEMRPQGLVSSATSS